MLPGDLAPCEAQESGPDIGFSSFQGVEQGSFGRAVHESRDAAVGDLGNDRGAVERERLPDQYSSITKLTKDSSCRPVTRRPPGSATRRMFICSDGVSRQRSTSS